MSWVTIKFYEKLTNITTYISFDELGIYVWMLLMLCLNYLRVNF